VQVVEAAVHALPGQQLCPGPPQVPHDPPPQVPPLGHIEPLPVHVPPVQQPPPSHAPSAQQASPAPPHPMQRPPEQKEAASHPSPGQHARPSRPHEGPASSSTTVPPSGSPGAASISVVVPPSVSIMVLPSTSIMVDESGSRVGPASAVSPPSKPLASTAGTAPSGSRVRDSLHPARASVNDNANPSAPAILSDIRASEKGASG
jgi:hypothetical protein